MNVNKIRGKIKSKDPYEIASAFTLPPLKEVSPGSSGKSRRQTFNERLTIDGVDWSSTLNAFLEAQAYAFAGDPIQCFTAQSAFHSALNHLLNSSPGNILIPALHVTCKTTHHLAIVADKHQTLTTHRNDHARLQSAVTLLQESFSKTLNDRKEMVPGARLSEDGSKKVGVLYIVNQLFAMYFRLNTLRLCKNLLRPVETRNLHKSGNTGDIVTYRYFVGRLNMFEDMYDLAEENLNYAFVHCHKDAVGNKRRILNYLIPVKMLRGRLPTESLLRKYCLIEYIPFVHAIRRGDLRTFHETLAAHQDEFIRRGTYLLLEKCQTVCHRNLFKRIYRILEKHQLPLDNVVNAVKWLGMDMDLDEVECILANLIFRGYVRGYLSHSKRILVLSKKDPFPIGAVIKQ